MSYQDGHQTRDFVYVDDVCDVCMYHDASPTDRKKWTLQPWIWKRRTFLDLVKATFYAMGREPNIVFIDTPQDIRDTYQYFTEADVSKLRETVVHL